jgi:hypothetical protein
MWLKPKIIDSALLARGLTMFTGFISTLVTSKTIISAFGTDGFQIYGIWLALATFGGLIEIGRFSQQMYIINNPVLEMNVRVALLKKLYKRVGADCLAISILIISFIVWKIDRNPLLLTTMILAAFLSLFSPRMKHLRRIQRQSTSLNNHHRKLMFTMQLSVILKSLFSVPHKEILEHLVLLF